MMIKGYKQTNFNYFVANYKHKTDCLSYNHYTVYDRDNKVLYRIFSRDKNLYNDIREIDYLIWRVYNGYWKNEIEKDGIIWLDSNYEYETNNDDIVWIIDFKDSFHWLEYEKDRKVWDKSVTVDRYDPDVV